MELPFGNTLTPHLLVFAYSKLKTFRRFNNIQLVLRYLYVYTVQERTMHVLQKPEKRINTQKAPSPPSLGCTGRRRSAVWSVIRPNIMAPMRRAALNGFNALASSSTLYEAHNRQSCSRSLHLCRGVKPASSVRSAPLACFP